MKVSFISDCYKREARAIGKKTLGAIRRCVMNGDFIYRQDLVDFEKNFAKFTGTKYCIGTGSCSNAMLITLKALGIGQGDEVITAGHTYIATIDAIVNVGAEPSLVDVNLDGNMNVEKLAEAINPATRAIIVVHLNGRMAKMDEIMRLAKKHKLYVIEDAAQAAGATYRGRKAGSWGNAGCYSFYPAKVLGSYGEGGAVCTSDKTLADKLYLMRDHGESPSYRPEGTDFKVIHFFGQNTILDNISAAVLNIKLEQLPGWIECRRRIAIDYVRGIGDVVETPPMARGDVMQNFVIRTSHRDALREHLRLCGIETLISWPLPNHKQLGLDSLHDFELPVTDELSDTVLSLPMHPWLTTKEVAYVVSSIRNFFER